MTTEPLDPKSLLQELTLEKDKWTGIAPEADMGHVHLQVSDLARSEEFYHDLLGLSVTQRDYPGALFLSAGGYHHHVGLNIWAGAGIPPPPPDAAGLLSFAFYIPDEESWQTLRSKVIDAGVKIEDRRRYKYGTSILIRDPDGNGVELLKTNNHP